MSNTDNKIINSLYERIMQFDGHVYSKNFAIYRSKWEKRKYEIVLDEYIRISIIINNFFNIDVEYRSSNPEGFCAPIDIEKYFSWWQLHKMRIHLKKICKKQKTEKALSEKTDHKESVLHSINKSLDLKVAEEKVLTVEDIVNKIQMGIERASIEQSIQSHIIHIITKNQWFMVSVFTDEHNTTHYGLHICEGMTARGHNIYNISMTLDPESFNKIITVLEDYFESPIETFSNGLVKYA